MTLPTSLTAPATEPAVAVALTDDEWDATYGGAVLDGDGQVIRDDAPDDAAHTWSVIDSDDGTLWLLPGIVDTSASHHVGYVVSVEPHHDGPVAAIWWESEEPSLAEIDD